jgi:D-methionine transport system substrate-binding protein
MKLRKLISAASAAAILALSLTACSGSTTSSTDSTSSEANTSAAVESDSNADNSAADEDAADVEDDIEDVEDTDNTDAGYSVDNPVTVKVGLTGNIYEEIWDPIAEELKDEGIIIEYEQFTNFSLPNNALANGDIDMNAFQHHAYFENDTTTNGYDLTAIGDTYIVAMNIYSNKGFTIDSALAYDGTLKVGVPNDVTNEGRALKILEKAGFFTIDAEAGDSPEIENIVSYNVPIEFVEVDANLVYSVIDDVDIAVINGNYALDSGLTSDDAIYEEGSDVSDSYKCLIAVRSEDADNAVYKRIVEAYQTEQTEQIFKENFKGFFVPAWK